MSMCVSLGPRSESVGWAPDGYNDPRPSAHLRDRLMTFSSLKIHHALPLLLLASSSGALAQDGTELLAAETAVAAAERAAPRGEAARLLDEARAGLLAAREANSRRKRRDAAELARVAEATADLARATAQRDAAQAEVESKAARNADLRRRLLVNGGNR